MDIVCDARGLAADVTLNRDIKSPGWQGTMALDIIAFVPVFSDIKYLEDAAYGVKMVFKNGSEAPDGSRRIIKAADSLVDNM